MLDDFRKQVKSRWGTLTHAEGRLIQFVSGLTFFPAPPRDDPAARRVRHELLPWLVMEQPGQIKLRRALEVHDSVFEEAVDLAFCTCDFPIRFRGCEFRKGLDVTSAHFRHLEVVGGTVYGLRAGSVHVQDELVLGAPDDAVESPPMTGVVGEVVLTDARIGRNLKIRNATLRADAGVSLRGDRIRVTGNVELGGRFVATGALRFVGARIDGTLNAIGVELGTGPGGAEERETDPGSAALRRSRDEGPWPWHVPASIQPVQLPPDEEGSGDEKYVMNLEGARVDGDVYLKRALCRGGVRLVGATVGDTVDLRGARLEGVSGPAFAADRLKTGGTVFLHYSVLQGTAMLQGATIGGNLDLGTAQLQGEDGLALRGERMHVRGNLLMNEGFAAFGCVDVSYATVDANWLCSDCAFVAPVAPPRRPWDASVGAYDRDPEECLAGMGVAVKGTLEMNNGFLSRGVVRLTGISVHQDAILSRANFQSSSRRVSLRMERADVRGDLSLERSYVDGSVGLSGTRIKGSLRFDGATLATPRRYPQIPANVDGSRLQVGGDLTFNETMVEFGVGLEGAVVDRVITFHSTNFVKPVRLEARYLDVKGAFVWKPVSVAGGVVVDLSDATLGCIEDDGVQGWPGDGGLMLDGCEYTSINSDSAVPVGKEGGALKRLEWLRKQKQPYLPQPFEQLAAALRRDGYNRGARKVMMEREAARRQEPGIPALLRFRNRLSGALLGHGYNIGWTVLIGAVWVLLSAGVFDALYNRDGMHRLKGGVYAAHATDTNLTAAARGAASRAGVDTVPTYPRFQPLVYSLDTFLPIVDLRQQEFWLPDRGVRWGEWFHWFHIAFGWVVSTLVVVGVTAMVRKDP